MSLVTDYWEWDSYWEARRRGRAPGLPGVLARGEPHVDEHQRRCEVELRPGVCVAWTAREGFCSEPADGLACVKHAEDFTPELKQQRVSLLTEEDFAYLATLPREQRSRERNRLQMKRKRQAQPGYCSGQSYVRAKRALESTRNGG